MNKKTKSPEPIRQAQGKLRRRILVVDDDEGILEAFELMLTSAGYEVEISTKNGDYMTQKLKNIPDLIILDMLLSGTDGRHICKKLKNQEHTKHIPIIMISAHPDAKKTALESGADDFIAKPFDMSHLLAKVKKYIE